MSRALAVCLLLTSLAAAPTPAARVNDLEVDSATYLGGPNDDAAGGIVLAPDGTVVVGGSWPGHAPGDLVLLPGMADGGLVRLSADGRTTLDQFRIGDHVADVELASDGRFFAAVVGIGAVMVDAELDNADWIVPLGNVARAATGGTTAAVLTDGGRVLTREIAGPGVGDRTFTDSVVADLAVSPDGETIVLTGYNNRSTNGTPVQVPFLRAFDRTLTTERWTAYDWSAAQLVSEQDSSLADSRGVRVAFGADGQLYFAGRTDGGNNTFRFDPLIVDRRLTTDELISFDEHSSTAGISGASAITVFARFDSTTGAVLKLQYLLARLSNGNGNTVVPEAITATAGGVVLVGGRAFATIRDRDLQELGGQPVGPYQSGEAFLLVVDADFGARDVWTVFTAPDGSQNSTVTGVAARGSRLAWSVSLDNSTARLLTVDALQPTRDLGTSAWAASWLRALFVDGFETGDLEAWDSSSP
ncbi:MAG: hypothetical protein AAGN46_10350 [Acidobacteriota bacterium]